MVLLELLLFNISLLFFQEMFLQCFAQDAFSNAIKERRKSVGYHHLCKSNVFL